MKQAVRRGSTVVGIQAADCVILAVEKRAIAKYASDHSLTITDWYEEVESAAKNRRKLFKEILKLLRNRRSIGLIMHKIDRGVRNLRDWADVGDLIDAGVDIRGARVASRPREGQHLASQFGKRARSFHSGSDRDGPLGRVDHRGAV